MSSNLPTNISFALRGKEGLWLMESDCYGDAKRIFKESTTFPRCNNQSCKTMIYSKDGSLFGLSDGTKVHVYSFQDEDFIFSIEKPRVADMIFSPRNSLLVTWEPYEVSQSTPAGTPNLNIWDLKKQTLVKGFVQKKREGWNLQWSDDESVCARLSNTDLNFFEGNKFAEVKFRVQNVKVNKISIPDEMVGNPLIAVYTVGTKGQPNIVSIYRYPKMGGPADRINSKSFYHADRCDMLWNRSANALLVLTATDTSADSYYGEQGLHFLSVASDFSCMVPRAKNGPVYHVEWSPKANEFVVVYGFMPAKATLYNVKCEPVFDFGTGPRNVCYFNPPGNLLVLAGFGNLQGNIEIWAVNGRRVLNQWKVSDATAFLWAPDGYHFMTATTTPRLRVNNGVTVWNICGEEVYRWKAAGDLYQVNWRMAKRGTYPEPRVPGQTAALASANSADAYVPPHLRGQPRPTASRFRDDYEPPSNLKKENENLTKTALKNKKKREKAKAKLEEEGTVLVAPALATAPQASSGDPEKDKKIRNIRKKLEKIKVLKLMKEEGKHLEVNQVEKMKTESSLMEELNNLLIS